MNWKKYEELFFRDITSLGGMFVYGIIILFLLTLDSFHLALQLIVALVMISVLTIIIRSLYFRPRPKQEAYSNFLEKIDASSFPSIHAARAWALALIIGKATSQMTFILLATLAVFVCFSRIALKKHHFSDVVVGSILGIAIAWIV